jgi:hypothetical protein
VTWQHLSAVVWLRWRIMVNSWRRAGAFNAWFMIVVVTAALLMAIPIWIGCFAFGLYAIPGAKPIYLLYVWDGLIAGFLLFWMVGLLTDLQRSETLSLSKFMHLPVSPNGAFLINYLSSFFRLSMLVFGPIMLGYSLALVVALGPRQLLAPLLFAAFLLMVTALTYQFQGWLAALMSNPRRRRSVVVTITIIFVMITQLPNMLNFLGFWRSQPRPPAPPQPVPAVNAPGVYPAEPATGPQPRPSDVPFAPGQAEREWLERLERTARLVNVVLPIGWLPTGVLSAAEGDYLPAFLGLTGMTLIGTSSLWMAYRSTVGQYQKQTRPRKARLTATVAPATSTTRARGTSLLEARVFRFSEPVSAIALAGLQSLLRAPEAKMLLLSPLFTGVIFGTILWRSRHSLMEPMRPMIALGAIAFAIMGVAQLMGNTFGVDRDGFRVFVLSSASRRDILLGKTLSVAPLALSVALLYLVGIQLICPIRADHVLAMPFLAVSMFLLFSLYTNLVAIYTPSKLAEGSLKPANLTFSKSMLQLGMFLVLFPLTQSPILLPIGIEMGARALGWGQSVPICLLLSVVECAIVVVVYRLLLSWEGDLFQAREQKILEIVTNRAT